MKKTYLTTLATATIIGGSVLAGGTALAHRGGEGSQGQDPQIKQLREDIKERRGELRKEKKEEHKQNITSKLKEKGFSDEQIKSIFEVFEAERPKHPEKAD